MDSKPGFLLVKNTFLNTKYIRGLTIAIGPESNYAVEIIMSNSAPVFYGASKNPDSIGQNIKTLLETINRLREDFEDGGNQ